MKRTLKRFVPFLMILLVLASIIWYLFVYDREFTRDFLLSQARMSDDHGNTKLASWFYDLAYEYSGQDENVAIELANQYKADGNFTKAEYTLSNAIADGGNTDLYTALCKTYVEQDKLLDAVTMLDNISNPAIKAELDAMRPAAPESNPAPGFYSKYISVELKADSGTLYYSTDKEYPSTSSAPYSEAIPLPIGETVITAICVGDNGLVSKLSVLGYTVGGVIEMVEFADPAMEAAARLAIGAEEDDVLYSNELWNITTFTIPEEAKTFEDLSHMPYLQTLIVENKNFVTLECLSTLTELTELQMTKCSFPSADLGIIGQLPNLEKLTLNSCGLSTVEGLAQATGLKYLDLQNNTLNRLDHLIGMQQLQELNLQHNAVTLLNAIGELSALEKLDLSYNSVPSLAPLSGCKKLTWLDADHNSLYGLEGVDALTGLQYLSVSHNDLTSIELLTNSTELVELNISNNTIINVDKLKDLVKLEVFNFSYNQIEYLPRWAEGNALRIVDGSHNLLKSIDPMIEMKNLTYVYLDYNQISSLDPIANCYNLVQVNAFGNNISDVSKLTAHNIIVHYDPT